MRAAIASMFELEIVQVPHFLLFGNRYFIVKCGFIWSLGYELEYYVGITKTNWRTKTMFPTRKHLTNGCIYASVPSKNYKKTSHAVLINSVGRVIHDPHPKKAWLNHNIIEEKAFNGWYQIRKREDNE